MIVSRSCSSIVAISPARLLCSTSRLLLAFNCSVLSFGSSVNYYFFGVEVRPVLSFLLV